MPKVEFYELGWLSEEVMAELRTILQAIEHLDACILQPATLQLLQFEEACDTRISDRRVLNVEGVAKINVSIRTFGILPKI